MDDSALRTLLEAGTELDLLAQPIEQDFAHLLACYSNTDEPRLVIEDRYDGRSLDWQVMAFGLAARQGIFLRAVHNALLERVANGVVAPASSAARMELAWFLFSQKAWEPLRGLIEAIDAGARASMPVQIADFYFLAFYRLQRQRIFLGGDREGFVAEARVCLDFLRASWPAETERLSAYAAMIAHVAGDIDAARPVFAAMVADTPFIGPMAAMQNVLMPGLPASDLHIASRDIVAEPAENVTLLSVDAEYFARYALLFAQRYGEINAANGLHFHCIGFDPRPVIAGWGLDLPIGVTVDNYDLTDWSASQRRGYYASARYLYLPQYLERYRSVMIADIDGIVLRNVAAIAAEHDGDDVVLSAQVLDSARRLNRLPWEAVPANSCMVRATEGGRKFAGRLADYLAQVARNTQAENAAFWFADQNALFYCWHDLKDEVRFGRFGKATFAQKGGWNLFESDQEKLAFMAAKQTVD